MGVEPKNRGKTPKTDGLFHGKPYEQMDDLAGSFPHIFGSTPKNPSNLAGSPARLLKCVSKNRNRGVNGKGYTEDMTLISKRVFNRYTLREHLT